MDHNFFLLLIYLLRENHLILLFLKDRQKTCLNSLNKEKFENQVLVLQPCPE
jgi:hypothetical protein